MSDNRTVRFSRMDNVVVMIFPSPEGALDFVTRLTTQNLLAQMTKNKAPVAPVKPGLGAIPVKARVVV
jgi:hypothetical protein